MLGSLHGVAAVTGGGVWAIGSDGLITSHDGGVVWFSLFDVDTPQEIVFFDELNGMMLTDSTVRVTDDGGSTWTVVLSADGTPFRSMSFVDANVGFVATQNHIVFRTTDGGVSWTQMSLPLSSTAISRSLHAISFIDGLTGWVVASDGLFGRTIFRTIDGGVSWEEQFIFGGLNVQIEDIFALDANRIWVVGSQNFEGVGEIVLASTDGGLTWLAQQSDGSGGLQAIQFVSPLEGWMVGRRIHRTIDGGITWTVQATSLEGFRDLFFINETTGFVVGDNGIILGTVTGGEDPLDPSVPVGPQFPVTPVDPTAPPQPQFPVSPVPGAVDPLAPLGPQLPFSPAPFGPVPQDPFGPSITPVNPSLPEPQFPASPVPGPVDALDPSVPLGPQLPFSPVSPASPFGPVPDSPFGPSPGNPFGPQSPIAPFGVSPSPFPFGPLLP